MTVVAMQRGQQQQRGQQTQCRLWTRRRRSCNWLLAVAFTATPPPWHSVWSLTNHNDMQNAVGRNSRHDRKLIMMGRRNFGLMVGGLVCTSATTTGSRTWAAETVGKDPSCNDATCLGVWDGLLADCPHSQTSLSLSLSFSSNNAACVSSQDDTPGVFAEPWDYAEWSDSFKPTTTTTTTTAASTPDWKEQMERLVTAIRTVSQRRGDQVRFLSQQERYVRVIFTDAKSGEQSVGEFYFTPNDTTVQFRIASLSALSPSGSFWSPSMSNMERSEALRKELRYLKVPVLRNRRRSFFFVEADGLDTFGPGSASLGPPAEMATGELEGRQEEDARLRIEPVQKFPFH